MLFSKRKYHPYFVAFDQDTEVNTLCSSYLINCKVALTGN